MSLPHHTVIAAHAAAILDTLALPDGWPDRGRAWVTRDMAARLRKYGWPLVQITAMLPQREHRGVRAGQQTGYAPQPVTVAPLAWLEELVRRCGCDLADMCRGLIPDQ